MDAEVIAPEPGAVGVAGAGTMGQGIAYVFAMAGFPVLLVEPNTARAAAAVSAIRAAAADGVARGKLAPDLAQARLDGLTVLPSVDALPGGLSLVVETVPERPDLKAAVLATIATRLPAIIASNTSSMSIDALAAHVPDPSRFLGMHFFNPVQSLKLVELIRGKATADDTLARARGYAAAIGKTTVTVRDAPGFATSRLDLVQALEAIRMVEQGVASPEDIDRAVTTAYRHPVGPLRLSDMVGLDVRLDIARQLERTLGPHFAPPRLLQDMVARGDLGAKSGRGFYDWPAPAAR
jgi:3-hydroxybutyryl-CoA dehydrogenase